MLFSIYLCLSGLKQSLSMVNVVLSKFLIIFCIYSVIFCTKMVELRTFALMLFEVTFIQIFMSIKLHFSLGPLWTGSRHKN